MSETRRLKMKIGDAEFEADVPESMVQPMYAFFPCLNRGGHLFWQLDTTGKTHKQTREIEEAVRDSFEEVGSAD
jgi:hypothetical protein